MEFSEKLQELRKRKNLTQEELSASLYVSRTAISKWESGRGYPSIDSLKAIAEFFSVSLDELLSGNELVCIAESDRNIKMQQQRDLVFGLLDFAMLLLLFIPLFSQQETNFIAQVSLLALNDAPNLLKMAYYTLILLTVFWGIALLALQNCGHPTWLKVKNIISICLSSIGVLLFMAGLEVYAASFTFVLLLIKGILLLKRG